MGNKIQIRRGVHVDLPILDTGELGFETDTGQLYIGNGGSNVLIGGTSVTHVPVTLTSGADGVLALSEQQIGLDVQAANTVLAGPTSGAAAEPTFRALTSDDIPTLDHGAKLSGLGDDDHTQYLLATGARTGASSQAQTFINGIIGPSWRPASDSATALQLQNAAGTAVLNVDTINSRLGIGTTGPGAKLDIVPSSSSDVVLRTQSLQSTAPLGSELVSNGDFTSSSAWTWGAGWTHDATNLEADHTTGNTAALTQNISVTNGTTYQVEIQIKNRTAGSVTLNIGGVYIYDYGAVSSLSSNTTYKRSLVANTTGTVALTITPSSDFNGSIDNVSVKEITGVSQPNMIGLDSSGSTFLEVRGSNSLGNLGIGLNALRRNTTGYYNVANGNAALYSNTTGYHNVANGVNALYSNTTGSYNVANGYVALYSNTTGYCNIANGVNALYSNTTGSYNIANGVDALYSNTTGFHNIADGYAALYFNTTGSYNVADGVNAGRYISGGSTPLTVTNNSVFIGANTKALADGSSNEIVIGYNATGNGSNTVTLGNDSITKTILRGDVGIGTTSPASVLHAQKTSTLTNAMQQLVTLDHNTSGTPAAGFGAQILLQLKSSTTTAQSAGALEWVWQTATHASRASDVILSAWDYGGQREGLRIRGTGTAAAIGFLGATPSPRLSHIADPSGGSTIDTEARAAINSILIALETFGFLATS